MSIAAASCNLDSYRARLPWCCRTQGCYSHHCPACPGRTSGFQSPALRRRRRDRETYLRELLAIQQCCSRSAGSGQRFHNVASPVPVTEEGTIARAAFSCLMAMVRCTRTGDGDQELRLTISIHDTRLVTPRSAAYALRKMQSS